jgi:hypothetical protein
MHTRTPTHARTHAHILTRRDVLDLSGRTFKMEPLATVRSLERFIVRKVRVGRQGRGRGWGGERERIGFEDQH